MRIATWVGGRWWGPAALALAMAAGLFFWPLAAGRAHLVPFHVFAGDPALEGLDLSADRPDWRFFDTSPVTMFYAQKSMAARTFKEGHLPLWNPDSALGVPLLANGQSQPFAPFFLPFMIWTNPWVFSWCLLVQLLFGGLGMARLLGALGARPWVGALGAVLFAFNPFALNFIIYSDVWAYIWFPWVFFAAEAWSSGRERGRWLVLGLAGMALGGHLEVVFLGAATAYGYAAIRLLQEGRWFSEWKRWVLVPLITAGVSAVWLLPFVEYLWNVTSPRFGGNVCYPYHPSAMFVVGGELFWPPALLALAALGFAARAARRIGLALLPGLLWTLVMMFPFPQFLQKAATFDFLSGRYGRSVVWLVLVVSTALGTEALLRGFPGRGVKMTAAALAGLALLGGLLARLPGQEAAAARHWVPLEGPLAGHSPALLAAGLGAIGLILVPQRVLATRWRVMALGALVVASVVPQHAAFDVYWNASAPRPAEVLRSAEGAGRLWLPHRGRWKSLPPNLGAGMGLRDVRMSDPFVPRRLEALGWHRDKSQDLFEAWDGHRAAFVGVGRGFGLVRSPSGASLGLVPFAVEGAAERGEWVGRAVPAGSPEEALSLALAAEHSASHVVYLEKWSGAPDVSEDGAGYSGLITLEGEAATTQSWSVSAHRAGWLVVRDLYWPGWRASVDGRRAEIRPADGLFRAVSIPAGRHTVVFRYTPAAFRLGFVISFLVLMGLVLERRRRSGGARSQTSRRNESPTLHG